MATPFNPPAGFSEQADFSKASQGTKADTSLGTLLEGLGTGIGNAVQSLYRDVKQGLRDVVEADTTQIQDMFIRRDFMDTQKAKGKDGLPEEIITVTDKNEKLKDAIAAGKISHSTYSMMLDASARSLRAKYPGFREEIDNLYQDVTGSIPANRVMADIFSRANNKDAEAAERRHQEHKAQEVGNDEYINSLKSGKPMTLTQLKYSNAIYMKADADKKRIAASINLEKDSRDLTEKKSDDLAREALFGGQVRSANSFLNLIGTQSKEMEEAAGRVASDVKAGKIPSQADTQAIAIAANAVEIAEQKRIQHELYEKQYDFGNGRKGTLASILSTERREAYTKEAMEKVRAWLKPYRDGDTAMAAQQGLTVKALDNDALQKFHTSVQGSRMFAAANKAYGPLASTIMGQNLTALGEQARYIRDVAYQSFAEEDKDVKGIFSRIDELSRRANLDPKEQKKAMQSAIDMVVQTMSKPDVKKDTAILLGHKLFGGEVNSDWFSGLKQSDREALYQKFTNPTIINAMLLNPETRETYKTWIGMYGNQLIGKQAETARTQFVDRGLQHTIQFDPKSLTFVPADRERTSSPGMFDDPEAKSNAKYRNDYIAQLNQTVYGWSNTMKKAGISHEALSKQIIEVFSASGVDISKGPVQSSVKRNTKTIPPPGSGFMMFKPEEMPPPGETK